MYFFTLKYFSSKYLSQYLIEDCIEKLVLPCPRGPETATIGNRFASCIFLKYLISFAKFSYAIINHPIFDIFFLLQFIYFTLNLTTRQWASAVITQSIYRASMVLAAVEHFNLF